MRLFVCTNFAGHYSAETAAIVFADDEMEAVELLKKELESIGLKFDGNLKEITFKNKIAIILDNGGY